MEVLQIDRTAASHGDYSGVVKLTYDEIVMIGNALYKKAGGDKGHAAMRYDVLYNEWRNFSDMTCYGGVKEGDL